MSVTLFGEVANGWYGDTAELIRFPGGEWHVKAPDGLDGQRLALVRGASADDLFALAVWADAVHRAGGTPHALIPYFPAARQDRYQPGEALSSKVYASFVNSLNLASVTVLDAHSPVILALLDRVVHVDTTTFAAHAVRSTAGTCRGVIVPDAGAAKRSEAVAAILGVPTYQALKHRDPNTGKLSGFQVPDLPIASGNDYFAIVDDICDGGGTFMGLAQATGLARQHLVLFVTHGIFSGKAYELDGYYHRIYTTDSIDHNSNPNRGQYGSQFVVHDIVRNRLIDI